MIAFAQRETDQVPARTNGGRVHAAGEDASLPQEQNTADRIVGPLVLGA